MSVTPNAISGTNWIDQPDCVLSAAGEIVGMEAQNLAIYHLGDVWRVSDLASTGGERTVTAVFSKPRRIDRLAAWIPERADDSADEDFEPRFGPADSIRWRLSPSVDGPGDEIAGGVDTGFVPSGIVPEWGVADVALHHPAAMRVDVTFRPAVVKPAPFDEFDFGRLWAGPVHRFAVRHSWGDMWEPTEDRYGNPIRRLKVTWSHIRNEERPILQKILWKARDRRQMLFIPRWAEVGNAVFARSTGGRSLETRYFDASQLPLTFDEDVAGD